MRGGDEEEGYRERQESSAVRRDRERETGDSGDKGGNGDDGEVWKVGEGDDVSEGCGYGRGEGDDGGDFALPGRGVVVRLAICGTCTCTFFKIVR